MELNKPNPFNPNKNQVGQDWQIWKKEFLIYLRLSGCYEKCREDERALILLNLMGTEGVRAKQEMTFDDPNEENDMDILLMKFDQIFDPPLNEIEERYKFFSRKIRANENIDNYVTDLKNRALTCNFGSQYEKFVIDMVIRNMDSYLQNVVFALEDVTLVEVVQYYKQFTINNDKIKELTKDAVTKPSKTPENNENSNDKQVKSTQSKFCWKCNSRHVLGNCPAQGNICNVCNQRNHFNGVCGKQTKNNGKDEIKRICSKCGTNHPFRQCPAYDETCNKCCSKGHFTQQCKQSKTDDAVNNEKEEMKRICSKCGTNHSFKQCPAYNETCSKCSTKGHFTQHCKQNKTDDAVNQNINRTRNTDNKRENSLSNAKLEDCLWCELKHVKNECPHPASCTRCDTFPHNICFKCKKNPHDVHCHYRAVITLPSKTPLNKSVENCSKCGTCHGNYPCNPCELYCETCNSIGHVAHNCALYQRQNNNPTQSNTSDPLLRDFVRVDNLQQPSSSRVNYQRTMPSSSTSNRNYANNTDRRRPTAHTYSTPNQNSYKSKPDSKKQNPKPDACTVS